MPDIVLGTQQTFNLKGHDDYDDDGGGGDDNDDNVVLEVEIWYSGQTGAKECSDEEIVIFSQLRG